MHRLVIALTTFLGLIGVAVVAGYVFLFAGSTDRAATVAPASTAVYVNVYLQPSAGQQMNLGDLIGRLPGFADEASLDAKIDQIVENLLAGTGIDYRADVKPWLGDQVALAAWPSEADPTQSQAVVIAEVKDPEAARSSVPGLFGDDTTFEASSHAGIDVQVSDAGAYAFVDDMLVIGEQPEAIDAVIDVAESGADALGARRDFVDAMDRVPADHLASVFVDLPRLADATGAGSALSDVSPASAVLVAEGDGLRLSGSAPVTEGSTASDPATLTEWMPSDTLAELVVFGLRQTLEDAEEAVGAAPNGEDITSALDSIRAIAAFGLGIDIDADVLPLLDQEVGIAVTALSNGTPSGTLLVRPSDPDAAASAIDRIAGRIAAAGGTRTTSDAAGTEITTLSIPDTAEVAYAVSDEGVVIIGFTTDDVAGALDAHANGDSLASTEAYTRTFEVAGSRAGTELYVDIASLIEGAGDDLDLPSDARDILTRIGGAGVTLPSSPTQIEFHAVLTIDEAAE